MNKITATGIRERILRLEVVCFERYGSLEFYFNGRKEPLLEKDLVKLIKSAPPINGTYYPEKMTMINAYHVLRDLYFDKGTVKIKVDGDIGEIPYEEEWVY